MNFIERIFGVAPDSGSEASERMLLFVVVIFTAVLLVTFLRDPRTQRIADEHRLLSSGDTQSGSSAFSLR